MANMLDQLIAQGLIHKSTSPCVVPALLVPKGWCMCVDSRFINKITLKCQFSILRLADMLDQLHGRAKVFSKLIFEVDIIISEWEKEINGRHLSNQEKGYMNDL